MKVLGILFIFVLCGWGQMARSQGTISKNSEKMSVAVWDTYVKRRDGSVMHFDIIVPAHIKDANMIHQYGRAWLKSKNEEQARLSTDECRFCHIEDASPEMKEAISRQGFYILQMEDIPAKLPPNPTRRDMVLHLRAHDPNWRFADMRHLSAEDLRKIIEKSNR